MQFSQTTSLPNLKCADAATVRDVTESASLNDYKVLSRRTVFVILAILIGAFSGAIIFSNVGNADPASSAFSVDEPGWVAASYYYSELLEDGDFDWNKWDCPACGAGASYGSLNMHLGEWLMAIPLKLDRSTRRSGFSKYYDVGASLEENVRKGQVPPSNMLVRARTAPAIFGVLCCVLVFAIGFWAWNAWTGIIASMLVLLNPVFLKVSRQAMTDTFYNFFLLGCCIVLLAIFRTQNQRLLRALVCGYGIVAGLACSVKVTGIVSASILFVIAYAWLFRTRRLTIRRLLGELALFGVSALATIYLLNPLFWPSWRALRPGVAVHEVKTLVSEVATTKHIPWRGRDEFLADTRYPQLKNLSHPFEFPLLFSRWNNMMLRQSSRGWENWKGPRFISLHQTLFELGVPLGAALEKSRIATSLAALSLLTFALTGIMFTLRNARLNSLSNLHAFRPVDSEMVPLMSFLANYLLIALFMKLNWDRYYLPTILPLQILVAFGVCILSQEINRRLRVRFVTRRSGKPGHANTLSID